MKKMPLFLLLSSIYFSALGGVYPDIDGQDEPATEAYATAKAGIYSLNVALQNGDVKFTKAREELLEKIFNQNYVFSDLAVEKLENLSLIDENGEIKATTMQALIELKVLDKAA